MNGKRSIWIGWDSREITCYTVARASMARRLNIPVPIRPVNIRRLQEGGFYTRPTEVRTKSNFFGGPTTSQLWDVISDAPMSTEFACSRFFTPHLAGGGLALFTDCDVMARRNILEIFDYAEENPGKAVYCVKHQHEPENELKMDGQAQLRYARKNWSSVMLFNCDHPANKALTLELLNSRPGRDLHAFCWLDDEEIGELPMEWNYLAGYSRLPRGREPAIVHWTEGAPCWPGYEGVEYAREFWQEIERWAA